MDIKPYINRSVIFGAIGFAGCLLIVTLVVIGWTSPRFSPTVGFAPADLTMIPAPTHTPDVTPTPTNDPNLVTPTLAAEHTWHRRLRADQRHRRRGITHPLYARLDWRYCLLWRRIRSIRRARWTSNRGRIYLVVSRRAV